MKNEETAYSEKTQYEESQANVQPEKENVENKSAEKENSEKENSGKEPLWKKAASGMGMGILLGSISSFATTKAFAGEENEAVEEETVSEEQPAWSDGDVDIASGVTDDMSFSQAFSAARAEVGSGGCFEWRGNVYSTFTAEEWNSMSAEEKAEYNDHFSWGGSGASENNETAAENSAANETVANDATSQSNGGQAAGTRTAESQASETQTSGNHTSNNQASGNNIAENQNGEEGDVEVVDVWHSDEVGGNYAHVKIDGEDYMFGDFDEDGKFDVAAADFNGDGHFSEDEVEDISELDLKVSDLTDEPIREEQEGEDVVILGVSHDDETGMNSAGLIVDNNMVVLVDVDGKDDKFDVMVSDSNGDGTISENEINEMTDVSNMDWKVSDFEEASDLYADNGGDYIAEN